MPAHAPPRERERLDLGAAPLLGKLTATVAFTALLGLSAQFQIPMPPDGVPQTLQTLVVIVAAMGLGGRWGTASVLLYLLVGALGMGVFAEGKYGVETLLGATGGYLLGFVLAQPIVAGLVRRRDGSVRGWGAIATASLAGHAVVFVLGVPWLTFMLAREDSDYTLLRGVQGGLVPFIPGMILKSVAAVLIGLAVWPRSVRRFW